MQMCQLKNLTLKALHNKLPEHANSMFDIPDILHHAHHFVHLKLEGNRSQSLGACNVNMRPWQSLPVVLLPVGPRPP